MQVIYFNHSAQANRYRAQLSDPTSTAAKVISLLGQGISPVVIVGYKPINDLIALLEPAILEAERTLHVLDLLTSHDNRSTLAIDLLRGSPEHIALRFRVMYQVWLRLMAVASTSRAAHQPEPGVFASELAILLATPEGRAARISKDIGSLLDFLEKARFFYLAQLQAVMDVIWANPCLYSRLIKPGRSYPAISSAYLAGSTDLFLLAVPPASYTGESSLLAAVLRVDLPESLT